MKKLLVTLLALTMLTGILASCGEGGSSSETSQPDSAPAPAHISENGPNAAPGPEDEPAPEDVNAPVTILVAAAASLEYSYTDELIPLFQGKYPWITVEGTYDSSGKLQTQIEEGLAADVFMSAAPTQMNNLVDGGFITESSVVPLLENKIVLIVPAGNPAGVEGFAGIAEVATPALGDPESVPAGQYAREALTSLNLWDATSAKASFGTNVTEVLSWVAEGSADAGIVYATDAATTERVEVIAAAPAGSLESRVIYPVGMLAATGNEEAAALFIQFLQSSEAIAIFEAYGFTAA